MKQVMIAMCLAGLVMPGVAAGGTLALGEGLRR